MGAESFVTLSSGKTAKEAFQAAREQAVFESGRGGYTGTIAEKSAFVMISLPQGRAAVDYANELLDKDDPRIVDKWGPAGCIEMGNSVWLFFGWASC